MVADSDNDRAVELSPSVPSGALLVARASGPGGTSMGVASLAPCPLGGAFGSTYALYSPTGTLVQTATADAAGVVAENYSEGTFAVVAAGSGTQGPAGPKGDQGPAGPAGSAAASPASSTTTCTTKVTSLTTLTKA